MPKPNLKSVPNRTKDTADPEADARIRASAEAMQMMRALDYEVQNEASEDLIAERVAKIAFALARLTRAVGYPAEGDHLVEAATDIRADLAKRYPRLKANARRPRSLDGLADDPVLLADFCRQAAESMELDDPKNAEPNDEVFELAREYDEACKKALADLVDKYPPDNDATAEDLWAANGAYLIFQTLNGAGVGIWDGDWTDFYEDTDKAEKFLKGKLGKFADDSGAGSLNEAFMNAADESCGGDDDDDESDDDDDEDDED